MSDDEYDYEFEYSDEDAGDAGSEGGEPSLAVQLENSFYHNKTVAETDALAALAGFQAVLASAESGSAWEWAWKARKNAIKMACKTAQLDTMLSLYRQLLEQINRGDVTRNRAEKAINSILDLLSQVPDSGAAAASSGSSSGSRAAGGVQREFYEVTLTALAGGSAGNERLRFKTQMKLARLLLLDRDFVRLRGMLSELVASLRTTATNSNDERQNATQLCEVYAAQIQMYSAMKDYKAVKEAYTAAVASTKAAVPLPITLGIIHECGGTLAMRDRDWHEARKCFLEAFKAYDEASATERTLACLRYLLLTNMLTEVRINPFDSQETKAYEKDPSIVVMTQLTDAFLRKDTTQLAALLKEHAQALLADEVIGSHVADLIHSIRGQMILTMTGPYSRMRLSHIAETLGVATEEVEPLLVGLILDGRLLGQIDQLAGILTLHAAAGSDTSPSGPVSATVDATHKALLALRDAVQKLNA